MSFFKENSYYLLVGVGKRDSDSEAMATSVKDAQFLQKAFMSLNLFSEEKIAPLINEGATKAEVNAKLDYLIEVTKKEPADVVIVFFSGHGSKTKDKYYLVCRDTVSTGTAIEGTDFVNRLMDIQCDKMLVLLDCCHSQGVTDPNIPGSGDTHIPFDATAFLAKRNKVVLTSSSKGRVSYLSKPVSLFTYAVIETLGGKFLEEDEKEVNLFNFALNVRERVVALSRDALKLEQPQQPQLNVLPESSTTNFTLAIYPRGGPQEVRLLKEELSSIKSTDDKNIDLTVDKKPDEEERKKLLWLVNNSNVQIAGDNGINLKDSHGNTITINYGMSKDELKGVFDLIDGMKKTIIKQSVDALAALKNQEADALIAKVNSVKAGYDEERAIYEENLQVSLKLLGALSHDEIITYDTLKKFSLREQIKGVNKDIKELRDKIEKLS